METPDGIETLLHVDDPMERRMALKSKAVQPSHLRQALKDEDPKVRAAAAQHPGMTPELIKEVFEGNDDWLKSVILERRDLRPEDLEPLVEDSGWSDELYQHPSTTPEQKERLNGLPGVAERWLAKNIGYITYPHLGEGHVRQPGAYYPESKYQDYSQAVRRGANDISDAEVGAVISNRKLGEHPVPEHERHVSVLAAPGSDRFQWHAIPANEAVRNRIFGKLPHGKDAKVDAQLEQGETVRQTLRNKALNGTEAHEVQHGVFARLAQRYGDYGRAKILHATIKALPLEDQNTIAHLFSHQSKLYPKEKFPEEAVAYLHNYLQDPMHRRKVHTDLRVLTKPHLQEHMQKQARKAWNALVRAGTSLKPADAGVTDKSDPAMVKSWVENLRKSREYDPTSLEDHLGHDGQKEAALAGVRFLTGRDLDPDIFRARLIDNDGDAVQAALEASGLTNEDRPALDAIMKLRGVAKAQDGEHTIQPLLPGAEEAAKALDWAFDHREVEPVHLGGKHSKGTLMAHDEDGNLLLVKPGSGKQSPAAGAAQEAASQSRREAAFSAVARAWGMAQFVPRADLVKVDGKECAVLRMLGLNWTGLHRARTQNPGLPRTVLRRFLDDGTLHKWAAMDWVLGNPDRHGNNIMVGPEPEHNVGLIDHGSAFAGAAFSPGRDQNSFVPYYLRIWGPGTGWSKMSAEQKAQALPTISEQAEAGVRRWVEGLDPLMLATILHRHGIDPEACVIRLKTLRAVVTAERPSAGINGLWLG